MSKNTGFHEIVPSQSSIITWKNVTIDTGASRSTLQDLKVPGYGGGYVYNAKSLHTSNRYLFWRVADDTVELWEESLNLDLSHNHTHLRIVGLPIVEGISVHEQGRDHVFLLIATIASVHCFRLPHPDAVLQTTSSSGLSCPSILRDLDATNLREVHAMHLLASAAVDGGRVQAACSGVQSNSAVFLYGQPSTGLLVVKMCLDYSKLPPPLPGVTGSSCPSYPADVALIKTTSLVNRLFLGFVPGMFRGGEGGDLINSLDCVTLRPRGARVSSQTFGVGVCGDGRVRVWCLQRRECVLLHDCVEDTAEVANRITPTGERHMVVCHETQDGGAILAIRLSFVEKQLVLLYNLAIPPSAATSGSDSPHTSLTPKIIHLKSLYPPQYRLMSMDLTPTHLWTLWMDPNNENQLLYCTIKEDQSSAGFSTAILQSSPEKNVPHADASLDPMEVYLQHLFAPYTFSQYTIYKALAITRTSVGSNVPDGAGQCSNLKEEVEAVLQTQLEAKITPHTTEDELYDLTLDLWQDFYSHTLQYHQLGNKGVSVVCGADGAVALVRSKVVSWLSSVDALETVLAAALQSPHTKDIAQVLLRCGTTSVLRGDTTAAASVAGVMRCITVMRSLITPEVAAAFIIDMAHHNHPEAVAEDVTSSLLTQVVNGDQVAGIISGAVSSVPNFVGGMKMLVNALNFDTAAPDALQAVLSNFEEEEEGVMDVTVGGGSVKTPTGRGRLWCSLVAASLHQLATSRLQLCRDLLVLQQSVLQLAQLCHLSADSVGQLRTNVVQETVLLTRAYHALLCLSTAPASSPSQSHLQSLRKMTAALSLHDTVPQLKPLPAPIVPPQQGKCLLPPATALQTILQQGACSLLQDTEKSIWISSAVNIVRSITVVAWPLQNRSGSTCLLEALVFSGQGEAALHYIRQVCGWCEWSPCSRDFLLGLCLLLQGQYRKAARVLHEAGEGCATEELLGERVGGGGDYARLNYTLRLVRLFEMFQQPGVAVRLATSALSIGQRWPAQLAQLYAVLFKHHLTLGHHDEAFTALLANPDPVSQKACLRQLLVALHNRGCLSTLVSYQYGNLSNDVVTILENRARSADILLNNYYHLLYAFHIYKLNYKRAASVMYECAQRLATEGVGEDGLKEQLKCYLACINSLKLLPADMAWILRPKPTLPDSDSITENSSPRNNSTKRSVLGERVRRTAVETTVGKSRRTRVGGPSGTGVEVLELPHIDREYQLLHARLTLSQQQQQQQHHGTERGVAGLPSSVTAGDAQSTVTLLSHAHLYREAIKLCHLFELSTSPVLQSLAATCVLCDNSSDKQQHTGWLKHNRVEGSSGWWDLLKDLLLSQEGPQNKLSELHCDVTSTLLERGHHMPPWLMQSYTARDYGGLLNVLLRHGHLEAASSLALRLLDALITGNNATQFGLDGAVHVTSSPAWLPYTALDHLLLELQENKHHMFYDKMLVQVQSRLKQYQSEVAKVSRDTEMLLKQRVR